MFYGLGKFGLSNKLSVLEFFEVFKVGLFLIARIKQPMIQKRRHKYPSKIVIERAAVFISSSTLSSDSLPSFLSSLSCVIAPSTPKPQNPDKKKCCFIIIYLLKEILKMNYKIISSAIIASVDDEIKTAALSITRSSYATR